jgi:hypothetical protein
MQLFAAGMITMGLLIAAGFFLRFWKRTRDPLFMAFGAAFVLLALNQGIASLTTLGRDEIGSVWLLRLAAFCLIIGAIAWKNLGERR